jgi:aspartate aminotransferase
MPALATRLGGGEPAAIVLMSNRAREMRAAGHDVISLAIGEPDFATPSVAIEAAHRAALDGLTKYPPIEGTAALKEAIRRKFQRDQRLDFPTNQIIVSNGGKQVIFNALAATLDEGDEVLIPSPYWSSYALTAQFLGGVPVLVSCPANNGFRLRPEDLEAAITPATKWVVLNAPNNPTGAAYTAEQLAALAAVLARHPHVWIFSDEIYEHLRYDGLGSVSIASVAPGLTDRVLVMSGVSKTYAMTGWRIGFAGGPAGLIRAMAAVQSHATAGIRRRRRPCWTAIRRWWARWSRPIADGVISWCGCCGRRRVSPAPCPRAPSTCFPRSLGASGGSAQAAGRSRPIAISRWRCWRNSMSRWFTARPSA